MTEIKKDSFGRLDDDSDVIANADKKRPDYLRTPIEYMHDSPTVVDNETFIRELREATKKYKTKKISTEVFEIFVGALLAAYIMDKTQDKIYNSFSKIFKSSL